MIHFVVDEKVRGLETKSSYIFHDLGEAERKAEALSRKPGVELVVLTQVIEHHLGVWQKGERGI